MDKVITCIIEKAWIERKYANIYARLCKFLQTQKCLEKDGKNQFKLSLLQKIQDTFEGNTDIML